MRRTRLAVVGVFTLVGAVALTAPVSARPPSEAVGRDDSLEVYVGTVNPNRFSVEEMTYVLIWAIVGGTATFYGPILGVVVLTVLNEVVLRALGVDQMRPMLYGAILILFILFLPNGLESLVPKVKDWWAGRKRKPVQAAQPAEAVRPASADLPAK